MGKSTQLGLQVVLIYACLEIAGQACRADELLAGAAKIDVTPPIGYPMWGYGTRHDDPSTGVLDPLHARAIVLAAGQERIALVSLDLGRAPTRQSTAAIRARVKAAAGIEHLYLVGSHTHHGPVLELDSWPDPKNPYTRQLEEKIAGVILQAAKDLRPARLGIASRMEPFNRNRHSREAEKPVDRELLVLRLETAEGKPIAHAVNFAAHPTMLDRRVLKFSADYVGALCETVETATGVPCLFLQGAAGDMSPNPGNELGPFAFGKAFGKEVLAMVQTIRCQAVEKPRLQVQEDDFRFKSRFNLSDPGLHAVFVAMFFPDLVNFYEREYRDGIRPHLTTALLNGRIGIVGVSGEFFCGHSLSLKRRARLDHVFFLGYCNDYHQYFPTIEAAAQGGYGGDPHMSPVEVGAGERMIDQALIHLYKMRGRLPNLPPDR